MCFCCCKNFSTCLGSPVIECMACCLRGHRLKSTSYFHGSLLPLLKTLSHNNPFLPLHLHQIGKNQWRFCLMYCLMNCLIILIWYPWTNFSSQTINVRLNADPWASCEGSFPKIKHFLIRVCFPSSVFWRLDKQVYMIMTICNRNSIVRNLKHKPAICKSANFPWGPLRKFKSTCQKSQVSNFSANTKIILLWNPQFCMCNFENMVHLHEIYTSYAVLPCPRTSSA